MSLIQDIENIKSHCRRGAMTAEEGVQYLVENHQVTDAYARMVLGVRRGRQIGRSQYYDQIHRYAWDMYEQQDMYEPQLMPFQRAVYGAPIVYDATPLSEWLRVMRGDEDL